MDAEDRIRAYVSEVMAGCRPERITAVERFGAGERNAVYRVTYLDGDDEECGLVVRVSLSADESHRHQAEREAAVLERLQGTAGPRLYDYRPQSQWFDVPTMCVQLLDGEQVPLETAGPERMQSLGALIRGVHDLPVEDLTRWFPAAGSFMDCLQRHVRTAVVDRLSLVGDPLPSMVQDQLKAATDRVVEDVQRAALSASFAGSGSDLALMHGDVSAGNVIWQPQPLLIDWEYARLGDPADEVAYTFTQNDLGPDQRQAFWRGYRPAAHPGRDERLAERVGFWEPATLLGSVMWWIEAWRKRLTADAAGTSDSSVPKGAAHYLDQALVRLNRFNQSFRPD